jgi:hypothetical protein
MIKNQLFLCHRFSFFALPFYSFIVFGDNDGNAIPVGIYFIILNADDSREVQKVVVSK